MVIRFIGNFPMGWHYEVLATTLNMAVNLTPTVRGRMMLPVRWKFNFSKSTLKIQH